MAGLIRAKALQRIFGDGFSGLAGAAVVGWGLDKLSDGLRSRPETLDLAHLKPGETYTISTRPAPDRRTRRATHKAVAADKAARRAAKPRRGTSRARRKVNRLDGRVARRGSAGVSTRTARRQAKAIARHTALITPSAKAQLLAREAASRAERASAAERRQLESARAGRRSEHREFR